jgi:hypothetical protein
MSERERRESVVAALGFSGGNHARAYLRKSDTQGGRGPVWEAEIGGIGVIGL